MFHAHICVQDDVVRKLQEQLDKAMKQIADLNTATPVVATPPARTTPTPPLSQPKTSSAKPKPKCAAAAGAPAPSVSLAEIKSIYVWNYFGLDMVFL